MIGSGETAGIGGSIYEALAVDKPQPLQLSVLETPAGFELNSAAVAGRVSEYLRIRLQNYQPVIHQVPARRREGETGTDSPAAAALVQHSQFIFAGPGSPSYAVRQLRGSLLWNWVQARHRLGASLVFASAAAIALGRLALPVYEIYKVGEDAHWKAGLDFFAPFGLSLVVVPHWNNTDGGAELDTSHCFMGETRFARLAAQLPVEAAVLGLDEHTGVVFDFAAAQCRVMGRGAAHVLRDGVKQDFAAGSHFPMLTLGAYTPLAAGGEGLDPAVWQEAQDQTQPTVLAPAVPEEVDRLVQQRQVARERRDWQGADRLRGAIEALGWRVMDTPDGPVMEKSV